MATDPKPHSFIATTNQLRRCYRCDVRPHYTAAMANDPLPTPKQREMLCDMIHCAFVELRLLGWGGQGEQAADLADAFHNISKEMYGWGSFRWDIFRGMLETYQRKRRGKATVSGRDYVEMLDEIRRVAEQ